MKRHYIVAAEHMANSTAIMARKLVQRPGKKRVIETFRAAAIRSKASTEMVFSPPFDLTDIIWVSRLLAVGNARFIAETFEPFDPHKIRVSSLLVNGARQIGEFDQSASRQSGSDIVIVHGIE